ncbi:MAG: 3-oxoacyl-ACP reductase FabG, partial [Calditrichaeota bacterium]|nr:3-oxoacyl-ACP reductase FabG [Calditrichota bacterium]
MNLSGKNAIVTGSTRGIGKQIAIELAKAGANVMLSGRNESLLKEVAAEIKTLGVKAVYQVSDVQNPDQAQELIDKCHSELGSIDILVNNAGITKDNLLLRMKEDEWDDVININLKGTYNTIRAAAKIMMKQRAGKIINITSVVGVMGNAGQANYAASKAGVIGLTKSVAKELASRSINVNAIAPGYIVTDMTEAIPDEKKEELKQLIPLGFLGEAKAIADAVV